MNKSEFIEQFERLTNAFNTQFVKKYNDENVNLFWNVVKNLDISWFKLQVDLAIGDMIPLKLSDVRDAALKKRNEDIKYQELKMMKNKYKGTGLGKLLEQNGVNSTYELAMKAKKLNIKL